MPFALIFIGMILVVTGIRDTYKQLGNMVVADMSGSNDPGHRGFIMFAAALGMVGALGSIPQARTFSHYFMALIIIALLLSNTGAMQKFIAALRGSGVRTPVAAPANTGPAGAASAGAGAYAGGGDPGGLGASLLAGSGIDNMLRLTVNPSGT